MITAHVAGEVRFARGMLTREQIERVRLVLQVKNPARESAERRRDQRAHFIAEHLDVARVDGDGSLCVPRGAAARVATAIGESVHWVTEFPADDPVEFAYTGELRGYQSGAVDTFVDSKGSGVIVVPCGGGKTEIGLAIGSRLRARTLVIVPTKDLLYQWRDRAILRGFKGEIGIVGDGKNTRGDLTIATYQSAANMGGDLAAFAFVVIDECVTGDTVIGGKLARDLQVGDRVESWSPRHGIVSRRVVRRMVNRATSLRTITIEGFSVTVTDAHPLWVLGKGWVYASQVAIGDVCRVQGPYSAARGAPRDMLGEVSARALVGDDGGDESPARWRADEGAEPHEGSRGEGETTRDASSDGTSAEGSGGEWATASGSASETPSGARDPLGGGVRGTDAPIDGTPAMREDRRCALAEEDRDRGGRRFSLGSRGAGTGRAQVGVSRLARVDRIEVHEPGSDGTFGGRTPNGAVYNFEIEGEHNFFANGILTHNCHHIPARTMFDLLRRIPARRRLGLTATPNREDTLTPLVTWTIGRTLVTISQRELEDAGAVVRPTWTYVDSSFSYDYQSSEDWAPMCDALEIDPMRRDLVAFVAAKHADGRMVLVLTGRKAHAVSIAERVMVGDPTLRAHALTSETKKKDRAAVIELARSGAIDVLVATQLADEGLDLPRLGAVVLAWPGKAEGRIVQRIGRILRPLDGKLRPIVVDIRDPRVGPLMGQARKRAATYRKVWGPEQRRFP